MNTQDESHQFGETRGTNSSQQSSTTSLLVRLLYILLFFAVFNVVETIVFLIAVVCFVFALLKTEPPVGFINLGGLLAKYVSQIVSFLANNRDTAPWPFESWS